MRRSSLAWIGLIGSGTAIAMLPVAVRAQDDAATPDTSLESMANQARVQMRATAGVWWAALSGESRFGTSTSGGDLRVDTLLGLEDNEPTFAGNVTLYIDDHWVVLLDAFDFSTSSGLATADSMLINGTTYPAGMTIASDFGVTSLSAMAGYDFFGNLYERFSGPSEGGRPVDIRLQIVGGVRGINVDHRLAVNAGPTVVFDEWSGTLNGGVRFSIGIGPEFPHKGRWDVGVSLNYGMGGSSNGDMTTYDIDFGIHYTVLDHFGVQFGYRQIDIDLDASDASQPYRWDGRLAGLFLGGELKF